MSQVPNTICILHGIEVKESMGGARRMSEKQEREMGYRENTLKVRCILVQNRSFVTV